MKNIELHVVKYYPKGWVIIRKYPNGDRYILDEYGNDAQKEI